MVFLPILRVALASALLFTSVSAGCTNPRVRREWRSISPEERADWIDAINCLTEWPHDPDINPTVNTSLSLIPPLNTSSSHFDDFSYTHMDLNVLIHQTGYFFPFHRLFVQTFEDELRSKCGYTGVQPYWNWTIDAANFYNATIFSNSTFDGVGSWGDPTNDYQIFTGGFEDIEVAYPVPHHIRRNITFQPFLGVTSLPGTGPVDPNLYINTTFTQAKVDYALDTFTGNYTGFQAFFENVGGPHPGPHIILGGDMAATCPFGLQPPNCYGPGQRWSPNDPLFFLHHAMVDKVWYDWQNLDPSNTNAFAGGSVSIQVDPTTPYITGGPPFLNTSSIIPGDGFWNNVTIEDVMSTTGGRLCYIYA